jgi:hypothetical protein
MMEISDTLHPFGLSAVKQNKKLKRCSIHCLCIFFISGSAISIFVPDVAAASVRGEVAKQFVSSTGFKGFCVAVDKMVNEVTATTARKSFVLWLQTNER